MNIWVPKTKILENSDALPGVRHGAGGLFQITGRLPDGRTRVLAPWQKNLITDGGLNRWGTGAPLVNCSLGSGTTPPSVLDTNLISFQRQQNTASLATSGALTTPPFYGWMLRDYIFDPPGVNLSIAEIGVGWGTNGANLWSRSLIKDANGDPLVLNWLASETLTVTYEARIYPWLVDVPHSTVIAGVTYTGVIRPAYLGNATYGAFPNQALTTNGPSITSRVYSGAIGANTGTPSGSYAQGVDSVDPYLNNALKATGRVVMGPTIGNFAGGILSLFLTPATQIAQISMTPAMFKTNVQTLTINFDTGVWGRQP